jgi:hypothetical protein
MGFINNKSQVSPRRGLSFLEFIGCLVAMIGGVMLGAMYLGLDLKHMASGVLVQAKIVEPSYFAVAEEVTTELPNDSPDAQKAGSSSSETSVPQLNAKPAPTSAETRAATRAYWNKLTEYMAAEAQGRLREEGSPEEWHLYDYLAQRKRGHEQALETLATLNETGVDEKLVAHGQQVTNWHQSGVKLFDHALSLLSDGPGAKLTGPFAQSWQSAATQLRMEENLVLDRHKAVANYLDREYPAAAPFVPALQQTPTK